MATEAIKLRGAQGLLASPLKLGKGEKGYFMRTDNVVCSHAGVIEPRPGFEAIGATQSGVNRMWWDSKNLQVLRGSTSSNVLQKWTGAAWSDLDTTRKYGAVQTARSFTYLLSNEGLRKVSADNTTTQIGNVPEGLDMHFDALTGSTGWMPDDSQVGYRMLFGTKIAENEFFLGSPSGRCVVTNDAGGTRNVEMHFTVPVGITTSYFYQIYRTDPTVGDATTAGADIDPGDTMYLVFEATVTSTNISDGYITYIDTVPEGGGGAALYTNQDQQTDTQGNFACEAALSSTGRGDLALFAGCLWAANYQPRSFLDLYLLSVLTENGLNARVLTATTTDTSTTLSVVSSFTGLAAGQYIRGTGIPAGTTIISLNSGAGTLVMSQAATASASGVSIEAGDILTIAGVDYYASTVENTTTRNFLVSPDASVARALRLTCESLVEVINRAAANTTVYARALSGVNEFGGHILIQARTDRASTYTVSMGSHGGSFSPNLSTAQTILSKGEPGLLLYSKPEEPEAWAPFNFLPIPGNPNVYALTDLRAALLVWTDQGLYRVTGTYGNFGVDLVDRSAVYNAVAASNAGLGVVVVDNVALALTDKGVLAATESGTQLISDDVNLYMRNIAPVDGRMFLDYADSTVYFPLSFGTMLNHSERNVWLGWDTVYTCGVYDRVNKVLFAHAGTQTYRARSATGSGASFYDTDAAVTINNVTGNTITLASAPSGWAEGDLLIQGAVIQVIESIASAVITVEDGSLYSTGAATVRIGYTCRVDYCPVGGSMTRYLRDADILFDGAPFAANSFATFDNTDYKKWVALTTATDLDPVLRTVSTFSPSYDFPFMARVAVPNESARCAIVALGARWRCTANATRFVGIDCYYEPVSERTRR